MPRYYFHLTDGFVDHDEEGTELENIDAARAAAVIFAGESLRDNPKHVWNGQEFRVEVTDGEGRLLLTIVSFAVEARSTRTGQDREKT